MLSLSLSPDLAGQVEACSEGSVKAVYWPSIDTHGVWEEVHGLLQFLNIGLVCGWVGEEGTGWTEALKTTRTWQQCMQYCIHKLTMHYTAVARQHMYICTYIGGLHSLTGQLCILRAH